MNKPIIQTDQLTVYYGKHRGIIDLDLEIREGEVFGFLGPNGSGKTTTLRVLLDIIRPSSGSARIFGLDCQQDGVQVRRRIGYLPGELAMPARMRGRSYLNMIDSLHVNSADVEYRRQLCARFDLDISRRIRNYSRGNKQKLALVAAFMHRPDLLILDEPTGGLDPLVQQAVLDTVREARADGRTVFFSSHILPEVQAVCDRVGIIRDGELVSVENVHDLLQRQFGRLEIFFAQPAPPAVFAEIEGVKSTCLTPTHYSFEVRQNMPLLMRAASQFDIVDLNTHELSLEEVFLAYYGSELLLPAPLGSQ